MVLRWFLFGGLEARVRMEARDAVEKENIVPGNMNSRVVQETQQSRRDKRQYTWGQPWSWKGSGSRILPWCLAEGSDKSGFEHKSSEDPHTERNRKVLVAGLGWCVAARSPGTAGTVGLLIMARMIESTMCYVVR